MKQATNRWACFCSVAGPLLPVSEADAATYGISAVYQLDDGSYRVEGSQKGFQSDVQAAVTIDAEGNVSAVEILSQDETESLGGQCVNPEFTSQYQGAAPFTLAGKSYTVTDPVKRVGCLLHVITCAA